MIMKVNPRKPVRLKNTSKYWNSETCKTHVTFSSPESYQSFKIKQEGYETRLYWQYKYCEDVGGQTFFYTLTYNDAHIPKYDGFNCFDYEDLRDLLTGGFRKILLRKYGTIFKYFIGAELGDGKGERGFQNNPHYHVLFFLEPAPEEMRPFVRTREKYEVGVFQRKSKYHNKGDIKYSFRTVNKRVPYIPISPVNFRHLVRNYWQGFDEDVDGFHDFREARYGIACPGENIGKVVDFRACVYCAKYVVKDAGLKKKEDDVIRLARIRIRSEMQTSPEFHNWFFRNVVWNDFNVPLNSRHTDWMYKTANELIWHLLPNGLFKDYAFLTDNLTPVVLEICRSYNYWDKYREFFDKYLDDRVQEALNVYRNRYCNKPRISHGVGDYALNFVDDKLDPKFPVPSKDGFKFRPMSMYYYRKLFTDVYVDKKGSPIRVLNDDGIAYKVNRLQKSIDKMADKAVSNLSLILGDSELFYRMRNSDVNTNVTMDYAYFIGYYDKLLRDFSLDKILKRYGEYKLVYEDRFFPFQFDGSVNSSGFPVLSLLDDYKRFLQPSYFSVSRSDVRLDVFLENGCPDCLPYSAHPYFLRFLGLFNVLDLCTDYFFVQDDIKNQKEAEEIASVKRFHDKNKLKSFFNQFQ